MTDLPTGNAAPIKAWLPMGGQWLLVCAFGWVGAHTALAQTPASDAPNSPPSVAAPSLGTPGAATRATSSAWRQLTPVQRQALAPLGAQWSALSPTQQQKWLTISKNFNQLSVADQVTMHSRMADWVDLSPQQRQLARLNFNQLQSLPKEDKKAKWEAYQALPAEEKRLLSQGLASPSKSAAPTAKPLEPHRRVQTTDRSTAGTPAQPSTIDRKTLLPIPPVLATPQQNAPSPSTQELPEGLKPASETSPS